MSRYIEMCRKATEVQEIWSPEEGDRVWSDLRGQLIHYPISSKGIWLPYQHQIQYLLSEVMFDNLHASNDTIVMLDEFSYWALESYEEEELDWSFKGELTMDELWLAFFMKIAHKKHWNGENWV